MKTDEFISHASPNLEFAVVNDSGRNQELG